jgi:hypothetical protein
MLGLKAKKEKLMHETINGFPIKWGLNFLCGQYFTEKNDHNPLVIPYCPHCIMGRSAGQFNEANKSQGHVICEHCSGSGNLTPPIPVLLFENNSEPIKVSCNPAGFLRCPYCNLGFKYYDKRVWSGRRHSCGQKLVIETSAHITEK